MCTVFKLQINQDSRFLVGKNYDTPDPCYGMIFSNNGDIDKTALIMKPDHPKQWTSCFGNVTFSQVGKEFPSCGMNEAGLVVEQTTLWNTVYPDRDSRPALQELQWIQHMLDTCSTVDQVIDCLQGLRVAQEAAKIQYFVCDETGDVALVEYLLGREIVFRKEELPYPVIANDMYQTSIDYLHLHAGYGGSKSLRKSSFSIDRFATTVDKIRDRARDSQVDLEVESGFDVLQQAAFDQTQWQVIYQPRAKLIWYRSKTSPVRKMIDLGQIDFSEPERSYVKNIESDQSEAFLPYSTEINLQLAKSFFATNILGKTVRASPELVEGFAQYPATLKTKNRDLGLTSSTTPPDR